MKRNRVIASWSELALVELQDDERKRRKVIVVMSKNDEDDVGRGVGVLTRLTMATTTT